MNKNLKAYIFLWLTQSLSTLGSAMTGYALVLWLYQSSGSALQTALLTVCTYSPYVIMSIFAGSLADRFNKKKVLLICDLLAAVGTMAVLILIKTDSLLPWHLYLINAFGGLMNTVQQPAGEIAATLLVPPEYYQKTSGMRSFSQSLNTILNPVLATAIFAFAGIEWVITVDLVTFGIAFISLMFFIKIPEKPREKTETAPLLSSAKEGLCWLGKNPLILKLIMFLAAINLVASVYDAAMPAMVLSKENETALGAVNAFVGAASLLGSVLATALPAPKSRVRAICISLLISMSTENFLLAFGHTPALWCIGAVLGWLPIPYMNANMDVIFRSAIPAEMQGRVYSCRNTLQFFTIPLGFFLGGLLVDNVFEPFMAMQAEDSILREIFGMGKGSGAALLFAVIGVTGVIVCLIFGWLLRKEKA